MSGSAPAQTSGGRAPILRPRRLYLRCDHKVRTARLGIGTQVAMALALSAMIGWSGYASLALITERVETARLAGDSVAMEAGYRARIAALEAESARLAGQLLRETGRAEELADRLVEERGALNRALTARIEAEAESTALARQIAQLRTAQRKAVAEARDLGERLSGLMVRERLGARPMEGLGTEIGQFARTAGEVIAERDNARAKLAEIETEMAALEARLVASEARRERMLARLEAAAKIGLVELRSVMERAGLDREELVSELKRDYSGTGGPFVPIDGADDAGLDADDGDLRVAALMRDLEEASLLRMAVDRLPMAEPVFGARRTSGFGKRRDPIRRRWSFHKGVDWAAPKGTPIHSTAGGIVVYAGRMRGYGIVVKIRHAFGFETLYAHLSRARVEVGQRVERGDRIADMGSTGRSTGVHLHYEIRIDDKPINPLKFIEAARDVL